MLQRVAARCLDDRAYVDAHFTPSYGPWDQRLTIAPDGDLFTAIRDGQTTWAEQTEKAEAPKPAADPAAAAPAATSKGTEGLKARVAKKPAAEPPKKDPRDMTEDELLALDDQRLNTESTQHNMPPGGRVEDALAKREDLPPALADGDDDLPFD